MARLAVHFEVILPKDKDWPQSVYDKWDNATTIYFTTVLKAMIVKDFNATVEGWNHKPSFKAIYSTPYNTQKQLTVEPFGRYTLNWARISEGTRDRSIVPRSGNAYMTFQRFYTPHTRPGGEAFWGGPGSDGGPIVHPRVVQHHSIKARKFTKEIAKKEEDRILSELRAIASRIFK